MKTPKSKTNQIKKSNDEEQIIIYQIDRQRLREVLKELSVGPKEYAAYKNKHTSSLKKVA